MKKIMKRTMREIASLMLVMAMVLATFIPVNAEAEERSGETMADVSDHTFRAYQIFTGTQDETQEYAKLGNVNWGAGVNYTALLEELKATGDKFDKCATAFDVAEVLGTFGETSQDARNFSKLAYKHRKGEGIPVVDKQTGLESGYYLVVDETVFAADATDTYKNLALLQVTNDSTFDIASKVDIPSVEKKVQDINDTLETTLSPLQDSADYDIGDNVPFTLIGTLPSRLSDYDTYKYIFHDTLSSGLTYIGPIKVYAVNGGTKNDLTSHFSITHTNNADGSTALTIATDNICAAGNHATINATTKIVVEYTAQLNENAEIGYKGNPNTVYLEYSNNPNVSGEGNNETGRTPDDTVIVFTYKLDVLKKDTNLKELAGAGFTLSKLAADGETWNVVKVIEPGEHTTFSFVGLDDGEYKLHESVVPNGYNQADDIIFDITAEHEVLSDSPALTSLTVNNKVITVEHTSSNNYYTGVLSTTVLNNEGHVLPETGGVGTTMFYIVGAVLVTGAVVVMITKKRMSK